MIENCLHFPLILCDSKTKKEKHCKCFRFISPKFRGHHKEVDGFTFYSVTARGYKYEKSKECKYTGQYATYRGPFSSVSDDDGHTHLMGIPFEICTDTVWKLTNPPYKGMI